ncbi:hypothetical protein [Sulfobacillus thermosulfidooxidans]|uniref:hypothetical protein n=1 Tax=Sulfobacillus thermosulfidooxidans TaxID=28034 RepID=UPI001A9A3BB4|nr:hypothetical protein [Sulfobacillus thermosulfidooxidans]
MTWPGFTHTVHSPLPARRIEHGLPGVRTTGANPLAGEPSSYRFIGVTGVKGGTSWGPWGDGW